MGIPEGEGTEETLKTVTTENFPQSNGNTKQTSDSESSENTKHDKCQKQNQTTPWHMISKLQKTKDKGKTPEVRGKKHLPRELYPTSPKACQQDESRLKYLKC